MSHYSPEAEDTCLKNQASLSSPLSGGSGGGSGAGDSDGSRIGTADQDDVRVPTAAAAAGAAMSGGDPEKESDIGTDSHEKKKEGETTVTERPRHRHQHDQHDPEKFSRLALVHSLTGGYGASSMPAVHPARSRHDHAADGHDDDHHYAHNDSSSSSSSSYNSSITFPEGGLQAWLVVVGSFSAQISVFGLINSAAVLESWFTTHQLEAYSASEIGWIFGLYLFLVFFIGIQVGPVFDRFGPRWLVLVGSLLVVTSIMLLSLCQTYYQILLCYSVLGGLGGALLNTPAYACIAHFFNERRGLATGFATTAGGIGGILIPILMQNLLPRLGFAWSMRVLGFILLAFCVPSNLWLRTRLPLPDADARSADELDVDMDAAVAEEEEEEAASLHRRRSNGAVGRDRNNSSGSHMRRIRRAISARASIRSRRVPSVWPDFTIFRDKTYAVATAGVFFLEWGLFVPITFIVSYSTAHNQNANQSYTLLSLLNAGSVVGRLLPGLLADKFGRFNVIVVTIALSSIMVFALWLPAGDSHALIIAFCILFGFASGSNLGLMAVCLGQLCSPNQYGRYYSTAMMVASFGTLSSVPIGGALLGSNPSDATWRSLIIFSGVSYAVALACYLAARVLAVGWRIRTVY